MPEFKLSRFRYTWRGTWVTSTAYNKDDVVRYGGQSWVCIRQHTSDAFNTDQQFLANESATEFSPAWARMTLGYEYQGEWSADTVYAPGDIVRQGGNLYVADQGHTASTNFSTDYEVEITVTVARDSESTGNVYILDGVEQPTLNLVVGYTYVFNQNDDTNVYFPNVSINNQHPINFSADNLNGALGGGTVFLDDVIYRLDGETVTKAQYWSGFEDATTREVRLTVTDSTPTTLYYWCQNHLNMGASASIGTDGLVNKWKNFASGIDWDPNWSTNTRYGVNDVVRYGGYVYRCVEEHTSSTSTASGLEVDQDKWAVLYEGIEYRGQWTTNTRYRINDLVEHNGFLWRCKQAHTPGSDSTINFDSSAFWEAEIPGYEIQTPVEIHRRKYICV